jgi:glycosyltransferase involved in cell wall biosynthesis
MTTYNGEKYLSEQLASLDAQTRRPAEVIISDDGSSDGTWSLLEKWAAATELTVTLVRNPENLGFIRNFEATVSRCSGDYIALCDQDDVWRADKLERLASAMDRNANLNLAFSDARLVDPEGASLGMRAFDSVGLDALKVAAINDGSGKRRLQTHHTVVGATAMYRRAWHRLVLPYPKSLEAEDSYWIHDGWTAALLSVIGDVFVEREPLIDYRIHPGQATSLYLPDAWKTYVHPPTPDGHRKIVVANLAYAVRPLEQLSERLKETTVVPPGALEAALAIVRETEFLQFRRDLCAPPAQRVVQVARHLRRGSYRRYARSFRSAMADVLLR